MMKLLDIFLITYLKIGLVTAALIILLLLCSKKEQKEFRKTFDDGDVLLVLVVSVIFWPFIVSMAGKFFAAAKIVKGSDNDS